MLFNPNDKLTFGKYYGIELGMVYMLTPSYINWMLLNTAHCVGELDYLTELKVIDLFGDKGHIADAAGIDRQEIELRWLPFVDFEMIKHSGFEYDCISQAAHQENKEKLAYHDYLPTRKVEPESEREIFLFYPGTGLSSDQTQFFPTGYRYDKTGKTIITFDADNTRRYIDLLPHQPIVKVASFYHEAWDFEPDQIKARIETRTPFTGKLQDGLLTLLR